MKKDLDNELLEDLMKRAENDKSGKLMQMIQILIEDSATAAHMDISLKELAAVCTAGHFLGKNPDYLKENSDIASLITNHKMQKFKNPNMNDKEQEIEEK